MKRIVYATNDLTFTYMRKIKPEIVKALHLSLTDTTFGQSHALGIPIYETHIKGLYLTQYDVHARPKQNPDLRKVHEVVLFTNNVDGNKYCMYIPEESLLNKEAYMDLLDWEFNFMVK